MKVPILYEDNHLLIVEKPVNIPVQQDESNDLDLLTILKQDIKVRFQKPGNVYLGLVHRLDRPVGGVMVFAKTSKAASRLSDMIRTKTLQRSYLAVVRGKPDQPKGRLEDYLLKDHRKNIVQVVSSKSDKAKKAILDYQLLAHNDNMSLMSIRLQTGRSHQIRVQMATIGCPLYGDQKYGQDVNQPGQQIALWSHTIEFPHPTTKEIIRIQHAPPAQFPWTLWEI